METPEDDKKKAMGKVLLLMGIGFVIDIGTALIIYNSGKSSEAKALGRKYKWKFPAGKELLNTAGLVLVTSILTGGITTLAEKAIFGKGKPIT